MTKDRKYIITTSFDRTMKLWQTIEEKEDASMVVEPQNNTANAAEPNVETTMADQ